MLRHRIISAALIIASLLAGAAWLPSGTLAGILAALAVVGVVETSNLLRAAGIAHERNVAVAGALVLVMGTWISLLQAGAAGAAEVEVTILLGYVVVTCLVVLFRPGAPALQAVPASLLLLFYVPFLLNFMVKLLYGWGGAGEGRGLVLYLILVVKMSDTGAYFVGSAVGRHKLSPRISPAKTWEGCAGGVVLAVAASLGVHAATGGDLGVVRIRAGDAVALGVLLPVAGILGDLVESMLKRAAGSKDSGTLIRGMGGVLDLIDSLLLASPLLYIYLRTVTM